MPVSNAAIDANRNKFRTVSPSLSQTTLHLLGQTSQPAAYSSVPKYRAFVFEGNGRDQVEITVTGANRSTYVALADSALTPIASGLGTLTATLPYRGPDTEAFYILVKNLASQPARLTVHLKKTGSAQPADATR